MITLQHRMEAISLAYVHVVAARCGLTHSKPSLDYGIDLTLNEVFSRGGRYVESGCKLDIQVKSTCRASLHEDLVKYRLKARDYNALCDDKAMVRRVLVLAVFPADEPDWVKWTPDEMLLRKCAYWADFRGQTQVTSDTTTISVPLSQSFSPERLRRIMDNVCNGRPPGA